MIKYRKKFKETREERSERLWNEKFALLEEHKQIFGDLKLSDKYEAPYKKFETLRTWANLQRTKNKNNTLYPHRYILLSDMGFSWNPIADQWDEQYAELLVYYQKYGTVTISKNHKEYKFLYNWCSNQRVHRERLSNEQKRRLDKLGFEWKTYDERWFVYLERLKEFKKTHGHCNVPNRQSYDKNVPYEIKNLNHFVNRQRTNYNKNMLPQKYIDALLEIGFEFDPHQDEWERFFQQMIEYKQKHGICSVPKGSENKGLGDWVQRQRRDKDTMPRIRVNKLNNIGFIWNIYDEHFEEMILKLTEFKKQYGHCRVTLSFDIKLCLWVDYIRKVRRGKFKWHLSDEQIKRLNDIGFVWDPLGDYWELNFDRLVEFKRLHGHCGVKESSAGTSQLWNWVRTQRRNKDTMPAELKKRLNDLGFVWK